MQEPKIIKMTGRESFLHSLTQAGLIVTLDNDIQVLYQRDGNEFLCLIHKSGTPLNKDEAIRLTYNEYKAHFLKHLKEGAEIHHFKDRKVITIE